MHWLTLQSETLKEAIVASCSLRFYTHLSLGTLPPVVPDS